MPVLPCRRRYAAVLNYKTNHVVGDALRQGIVKRFEFLSAVFRNRPFNLSPIRLGNQSRYVDRQT